MSAASDAAGDRLRPRSRREHGARSRIALLRLLLLVILPVIALAAGGWMYLAAGRYQATEDAYAHADITAISSDVAGRVVAVPVHDNERVAAGQVLIRLDDRPYRIAVERAKAQLASARLQVEALRAAYRQKQADLAAAQSTLDYDQREFDRQRTLLSSQVTSQALFDQARNRLDTARQQVAAAQQNIANALAALADDPNIPTDRHPLVQQAQAQLDQAELDLSHTLIRAPADGIVAKVDALPVGNYLAAGAAAFDLIGANHLWIEANFKETQLTHMRVGQGARVVADTYPGKTFAARVVSVSPGTGSEFAVLPPQNATGNWVKVVQRLPVRLEIENPDPERPLRAGMSVSVSVDTRYENPVLAALASFLGEAKAATP